jgi:hypothetical protein
LYTPEAGVSWKWLNETLEENTKEDWIKLLIECASDVAANASLELQSAMSGQQLDAQAAILALSRRHAWPLSRVRVALPPVPSKIAPFREDREAWEKSVGNCGPIDLVRTPIWPEKDWPKALVTPVSDAEGLNWNSLTVEWHNQFYDALCGEPMSVRLTEWGYQPRCKLGETLLQDFYLGFRPEDNNVEPFSLR